MREQVEDPLREIGRVVAVRDILEQDGEFVAAEACGDVGAADVGVEATCDLDEHIVPGRMSQRIVDRLEVVEVEEDDGRRATRAPRTRHRLAHLLGEHGAVGEPGDGVVERLVRKFRLEALAFADVARIEQDPADVLVIDEVGEQDLELACLAVMVDQAALQRGDALTGRRGGNALREPLPVAGDRKAVEALPEKIVRDVTEDAFDRRALIGDRGVGLQHGDEVAGVADERRESRLAPAAVHLRAEHLAVERECDLAGESEQGSALRPVQLDVAGDEQRARLGAS